MQKNKSTRLLRADRERPTNRRQFLRAGGAAVLSASLSPTILGAARRSSDTDVVIGSGEHKYVVDHNWGKLPANVIWGDTHGVAVDAAGLIYIKHRATTEKPLDAIVVFDPDGNAVRSFGKEYHRGGHGIDVRNENGEEFLYLSDVYNRQVVKTSLTGEQVWRIEAPPEPGVYGVNAIFRPTNIAFAPDGGFYIGDGYGSHYIHQYDKDASWVRTWGGVGSQPGQMKTPHGMWLDDRPGRTPSIVVADRANARLQYFSLTGEHLGFVDDVSFPADIDIAGDKMLVPDLHARVSIFDKDNQPIIHLGYDPEWTKTVLDGFKLRREPKRWQAGKFIHPHDACFDKDGNIFVVEWVPTGRVTKLTRVS